MGIICGSISPLSKLAKFDFANKSYAVHKTPRSFETSEFCISSIEYRFSPIAPHFALIAMVFGRTCSALGRLMVRTPFSNAALALSLCTSLGSSTLRSNEP